MAVSPFSFVMKAMTFGPSPVMLKHPHSSKGDFVSADSVLITRQHLLDPSLEHTLILVKPDGYARGLTGEILRRIEAKGYIIKGLKIMVASREILAEHYRDHAGKPFFEGLLDFMSAGPLVAIIVEGQRVIEGMRTDRKSVV